MSQNQVTVPESAEQIFVMSQNIAENVKEDLAWGTNVLLRDTNSISVLISVQGALCVRGYWNTPRDASKVDALAWFQKQIQRIGLSDMKYTLYFPESADSKLWEMLPKGTRSILVQPVRQAPKGDANQEKENDGFVVLASSISYAFSNKDATWIGAVANKFRSGATPVDQVTVPKSAEQICVMSQNQVIVPESAEQIFVMSQNIAENVKKDLAWGTNVLLCNTNSISVLISVQGALCVRGYWNTPRDASKVDALAWFQKQIQRIGLSDMKDTLYFPESADSELWEMLPKGTHSILVQPVRQAPKGDANQEKENDGFVVLASSISYAFSNKDATWIGAVANKFRSVPLECLPERPGERDCHDAQESAGITVLPKRPSEPSCAENSDLQPAFEVLPDDLLVLIFSRLGDRGQIRLQAVCHKWKRLIATVEPRGGLLYHLGTGELLNDLAYFLLPGEKVSRAKRRLERDTRGLMDFKALKAHMHRVKDGKLFQERVNKLVGRGLTGIEEWTREEVLEAAKKF